MTYREYDFQERLAFSKGNAGANHLETIQNLITGCVRVEVASIEQDRNGIDYIATLRRGAKLNIDLKARAAGCAKFWKPPTGNGSVPDEEKEPDLALEIWSVIPGPANPHGKAGWTLDESKATDYTLHVFDHSDSTRVFLLPFQLLRIAFHKHLKTWKRAFRVETQSSGSWSSQCVFVPAWCVLDAIRDKMEKRRG